MNPQMLSLGIAGAVVSVVHGLLPNHWLPFVLIGRAQGWTARRTMAILVAAGAAHAAVAGAIAMATLLVGVAVGQYVERYADVLPGAILAGAGLIYVALDLAHHGHHHHHHDVHEAADRGMSDKVAITTLVLTLALSPCEAMVPVFVSAAPSGDPLLLFVLVVVSGAASIAVMVALALLSWRGIARFGFGRLAHRERLVIGSVLAAIGGIMLAAAAT
jgi:hypothetical protein